MKHEEVQQLKENLKQLTIRQEQIHREMMEMVSQVEQLIDLPAEPFEAESTEVFPDSSGSANEFAEPVGNQSPIVEEPITTSEAREAEEVPPDTVNYFKEHEILQETGASPGNVSNPMALPHREDAPAFDYEKFIGENLFNKIGIFIIILGVVIGAKYSIEHNLITPVARIIIGYVTGLGLLITAARLKKEYHNFSAVLMSGAIAILYFDTFAAYSFYELIPRIPAFGVMLFLTVFTVVTALRYNREVIAIFGLVGAYAIPFLLNDNSGKVAALFTYMAVINAGIMILGLRRYWNYLFGLALGSTWLIFAFWLFANYQAYQHFSIGMTFSFVFFALFYVMIVSYKFVHNNPVYNIDIILALVNSIVYYSVGYNMLSQDESTLGYRGLFTLLNGLMHAVALFPVYRAKLEDRKFEQVILSFILLYVTLTVPVQFDGSFVTILWSSWAVVLFFFAVKKQLKLYEVFAYCLMVLAPISYIHDVVMFLNQTDGSSPYMSAIPFFNTNFLTGLVVVAAFAGIVLLFRKLEEAEVDSSLMEFRYLIRRFTPIVLLVCLFVVICYDLCMIFDQWSVQYGSNFAGANGGESLIGYVLIRELKGIAVTVYLLGFILVLPRLWRSIDRTIPIINLHSVLSIVMVIIFGAFILPQILHIQVNYTKIEGGYSIIWLVNILLRYIAVALTSVIVFRLDGVVKKYFTEKLRHFEVAVIVLVFWYLSSELVFLFNVFDLNNGYKYLSILWGAFGSVLIISGIKVMNKNFRIAGFVVFSITLLKLFLYDLAGVSAIVKTLVFIIVGLFFLFSSFQYNKYTSKLFPENKNE